ncbi:hypothetical protein, partial [Microbacterium sp. ZXX196]|uniref:hypothetical protein n=1 Tax=Microbacterium sp. ZXX196 TaxID=2609291 RepID=UPI001E5EEB48
ELEETEERLFALRALARKHGVAPDDLGGFAGELRGRLEALDGSVAHLGALKTAWDRARAAFDAAADALTKARMDAAARLDAR